MSALSPAHQPGLTHIQISPYNHKTLKYFLNSPSIPSLICRGVEHQVGRPQFDGCLFAV